MKKILILLLYLCCWQLSCNWALLVFLKDGRVLHGELVEYDQKKLVISRLDQRGVWEIPWEFLANKYSFKLKKKLDLLMEQQPIGWIKGVTIYLKTGGVIHGKLLGTRENTVVLQNNKGVFPIPKDNVLKLEKSNVALTQIYSKEKIYQQKKKQYDPKQARDQLRFAFFLAKMGAYQKSQHHLQQAKQLSSSPLPSKAMALERKLASILAKQQKQKLYQKFLAYQKTHRYEKARELLEELNLSSQEKQSYLNALQQAKDRHLQGEIPRAWLDKINNKILALSFHREQTLEQAKAELAAYNEQVYQELAQEHQITEAQAREYHQQGSLQQTRSFSFGSGTFIAGLRGSRPQDPQAAANWKEQLEKISQNRFTGNIFPQQLATKDEWWQNANGSERRSWLQAFFYEQKLQVLRQKWEPCSQCAAKGYLQLGEKKVTCPRCHGVRYDRTVVVK